MSESESTRVRGETRSTLLLVQPVLRRVNLDVKLIDHLVCVIVDRPGGKGLTGRLVTAGVALVIVPPGLSIKLSARPPTRLYQAERSAL